PLRVPKSRRAALAGGAALVLTAAAAHAALAQQATAGLEATDVAAPTPDAQDVVFLTGFGAPDIDKRLDEAPNAVAGRLGVSKDRLEQAMSEATKDLGLPPPLIAPLGKIGPGVPGAFGLRIDSPFASAAKALNISEEQLHSEQAAGKSLAEIAR